MEIVVDILGLIVKTNTVLTDGIFIVILEEFKIDEVKTKESKTKVVKDGELTTNILKTEEVKIGEVKLKNSTW